MPLTIGKMGMFVDFSEDSASPLGLCLSQSEQAVALANIHFSHQPQQL